MWDAPELMEHAGSEESEAYSDVFEEEMPDQSADDASDTASIRSGMTLSCSRYNQSAEDYQEDEGYTQGQRLSIGMQSMLIANIDLIVAALTQVQLRHSVSPPCPQLQTLLISLAAYAVLVSGNQTCKGHISPNLPLRHQSFQQPQIDLD